MSVRVPAYGAHAGNASKYAGDTDAAVLPWPVAMNIAMVAAFATNGDHRVPDAVHAHIAAQVLGKEVAESFDECWKYIKDPERASKPVTATMVAGFTRFAVIMAFTLFEALAGPRCEEINAYNFHSTYSHQTNLCHILKRAMLLGEPVIERMRSLIMCDRLPGT